VRDRQKLSKSKKQLQKEQERITEILKEDLECVQKGKKQKAHH
jgi:hypothetical protein